MNGPERHSISFRAGEMIAHFNFATRKDRKKEADFKPICVLGPQTKMCLLNGTAQLLWLNSRLESVGNKSADD